MSSTPDKTCLKMNHTYDEFRKTVKARQAEKAEKYRPQLEMLAQAEVKAGLLTGDPNWDIYLSYLQAVLEIRFITFHMLLEITPNYFGPLLRQTACLILITLARRS